MDYELQMCIADSPKPVREEVARLRAVLKQVCDLAHCGPLARLTEAETLIAIRRVTVMDWDKTRSPADLTRDTFGAVSAAKKRATSFGVMGPNVRANLPP